jgi:hypothetical protein
LILYSKSLTTYRLTCWLVLLVVGGCSSESTPAVAVRSPSGEHVFSTRCVNNLLVVTVGNPATGDEEDVKTHASCLSRFNVQWRTNQEIMVVSSDIGIFQIIMQPQGGWNAAYRLKKISPSGIWEANVRFDENDLVRIVIDLTHGGNTDRMSSIETGLNKSSISKEYLIEVPGYDVLVAPQCLTWDTDAAISLETTNGPMTWRRTMTGRRMGETDWKKITPADPS